MQLHLVAELYHMQFLLQAAGLETFGYTLVNKNTRFIIFDHF